MEKSIRYFIYLVTLLACSLSICHFFFTDYEILGSGSVSVLSTTKKHATKLK